MSKRLNMFAAKTDELKRLIAEHPDHKIVVSVDNEVVGNEYYAYWLAPEVDFRLGKFLDCDLCDENIFFDREDLEDYLIEMLEYEEPYITMTNEEFDKAIEEEVKKYDEFWVPVIIIRAST